MWQISRERVDRFETPFAYDTSKAASAVWSLRKVLLWFCINARWEQMRTPIASARHIKLASSTGYFVAAIARNFSLSFRTSTHSICYFSTCVFFVFRTIVPSHHHTIVPSYFRTFLPSYHGTNLSSLNVLRNLLFPLNGVLLKQSYRAMTSIVDVQCRGMFFRGHCFKFESLFKVWVVWEPPNWFSKTSFKGFFQNSCFLSSQAFQLNEERSPFWLTNTETLFTKTGC